MTVFHFSPKNPIKQLINYPTILLPAKNILTYSHFRNRLEIQQMCIENKNFLLKSFDLF
ncbi:hypothetical protein J2772_003557 [Chryseobacterium jejuense]|nr:hypothetical protein [Chryseobacterium jejuense]